MTAEDAEILLNKAKVCAETYFKRNFVVFKINELAASAKC